MNAQLVKFHFTSIKIRDAINFAYKVPYIHIVTLKIVYWAVGAQFTNLKDGKLQM